MRMPRRILCLAVVAVALPAFAVAALAAPGDPKIRGAKSQDGPFQTGVVPVTVAGPRNLYVKVISRADKNQLVRLHENLAGTGSDYHFSWFKNDTDISHDVQTSGHEFTLKADKSRIFRVRVKAQVMKPSSACLYPGVDAGGGQAYGVFFSLNNNPCD